MACERYREALADVAAGLPAPAGLQVHLGSCEMCRGELRAMRQALAVADAEMAGLATAEPTPELAARIRQAVADARELLPHQPGRLQGGVTEWGLPPKWRFGWLWPATAAACMLLVALAVWTLRGHPSAPEPRVAQDTARPQPTGSAGASGPTGAPVIRSEERPVPVSKGTGRVAPTNAGRSERRESRTPGGSLGTPQGRVPRDDRAHQPEVIVAPGEAEALMRFVALVHRDRLVPASLAAAGQPSPDLAELAPIDIQPLEIVPLDPAETSGT